MIEEMVVDAHCHLAAGTGGIFSEVLSPSQLKDELQARGVEKAVVFTGDGFWGDCRVSNDRLAEQTKPFPGFFIPWATVHPYYGQKAVEELRRSFLDLGMTGLKLHPWVQGFSVSTPWMYAIVEEAIQLGCPITFHDGSPAYSSPLQIAHLAQLYPEATIVLAHSGLREMWRDALLAAQENDNVWLGFPGPPLAGMQTIVDTLGADRIIYGSDGGLGHPSSISYALRIIDELRITPSDRQKILGLNVVRLLEIPLQAKRRAVSG